MSLSDVFVVSAAACLLTSCATGVDVTDEQFDELNNAIVADNSGSAAPVISDGSNAGNSAGSAGSSTGGSGGNSTVSPSDLGTGGNNVVAGPPLDGGDCESAVAPIALGECVEGGAISILYTDRSNGQSTNSEMTMNLSIQNSGGDFTLSDLVIRYWFTADGQSDFTAVVDYSSIESANVCVDFGNQQDSGFADIGFISGQSINGDGVREVQVRINAGGFAPLTQTNDFSFLSGANGASNDNISVYLQGVLVAGCEP